MRELKFRGICLASGNMVFGGGIDTQRDTPRIFNNGIVYYVDAKTVGQFTGLIDKNGVGIYENDIVQWGDDVNELVAFDDEMQGFCTESSMLCKDTMAVIGNIHQDRELLK